MTSDCDFFSQHLWRHMLHHFYNEALVVIAHFFMKTVPAKLNATDDLLSE